MDSNDKKMASIKKSLLNGTIESFAELVDLIGKTSATTAAHVHFRTMESRMEAPINLTLEEIRNLAKALSVSPNDICKMVNAELDRKDA